MTKDVGLPRTEKTEFRTYSSQKTSNSLKTDKCMTNIPTVGSNRFGSFQTVICSYDRVSFEKISLVSILFFSVLSNPTSFVIEYYFDCYTS